jgi:hypothetical protein
MIHPIIVVLAVLLILSIGFAGIYLYFHRHTLPEERRREPENEQYAHAIEVTSGKGYSIHHQQFENGKNDSVHLTIIGPDSRSVEAATADLPAHIRVETDAEDMDEIAIAWIKYRKLSGTIAGPAGDEPGSPGNPGT